MNLNNYVFLVGPSMTPESETPCLPVYLAGILEGENHPRKGSLGIHRQIAVAYPQNPDGSDWRFVQSYPYKEIKFFHRAMAMSADEAAELIESTYPSRVLDEPLYVIRVQTRFGMTYFAGFTGLETQREKASRYYRAEADAIIVRLKDQIERGDYPLSGLLPGDSLSHLQPEPLWPEELLESIGRRKTFVQVDGAMIQRLSALSKLRGLNA